MTVACERYFVDYGQVMLFIDMIFRLAIEADDDARKWARIVLMDPGLTDEVKEEMEQIALYGGGRQVTLSRHESLLYQLVYVRHVNNYLSYLTDLFALVYKQRPEMLKTSNQQVKVDWLLEFDSMDALIAALTEKRVTELAHMGMRELNSYVKNRFKFDLYPESAYLREAERIIEIRNLIVHNRAIVNNHSLSRVGDLGASAGEQLRLQFQQILREFSFLANSVADIDVRAAAKFSLPTPRLRGGPPVGPFPPQ